MICFLDFAITQKYGILKINGNEKSMRMLFFLTVLLISSMIYFVGCSDDDWVTQSIYIQSIEVSISESRPAQAVVTVTGSHPNGCVSPHAEIHHRRNGNTIYISGQKSVSHSPGGYCEQIVTEVRGQVSISGLSVGEYNVIADDLELVFHIEDDESWIVGGPLIENIRFSISESVPAQVIVNVKGLFCQEGIPLLNIHEKQEGDTTYIQIKGKIPSSIRCPLVIHRDALMDSLWGSLTQYQYQVSIGEFTFGEYKVVINDIKEMFFISEERIHVKREKKE